MSIDIDNVLYDTSINTVKTSIDIVNDVYLLYGTSIDTVKTSIDVVNDVYMLYEQRSTSLVIPHLPSCWKLK